MKNKKKLIYLEMACVFIRKALELAASARQSALNGKDYEAMEFDYMYDKAIVEAKKFLYEVRKVG